MTTAPAGGVLDRLAGAPISWGVCEVPGWGTMLPRERVLKEMRDLGLRASELGALGYLGDEPEAIAAVLARHRLSAVGGFVPLVLHDPASRAGALSAAERAARLIAGAGGSYFVTAAVVDAGWSTPFELDERGWEELEHGLLEVEGVCADHGLVQVLHAHVGTLIERAAHIERLVERSEVRFCLDTGHFAIGGADPVAFAAEHSARVGLVHLKDVDLSLAPEVISHERSLLDATQAGLFRALGRGSVDVGGVVRGLESAGYAGWYVLEQDTTIPEAEAASADPAAEVRVSIDYLARLAPGTGRIR